MPRCRSPAFAPQRRKSAGQPLVTDVLPLVPVTPTSHRAFRTDGRRLREARWPARAGARPTTAIQEPTGIVPDVAVALPQQHRGRARVDGIDDETATVDPMPRTGQEDVAGAHWRESRHSRVTSTRLQPARARRSWACGRDSRSHGLPDGVTP